MIWILVIVLIIGIYCLRRGFLVEPGSIQIEYDDVEVRDLPDSLDGLTIVHLTDLHMRRFGMFERSVLAGVNRIKPDLVVVTGDYADGPEGLGMLWPFLMEAGQGSRLYGILGDNDHDEWLDTGQLIQGLEKSRARVLVNDSDPFLTRGAKLNVVGVDDPHEGFDDLDKALERVEDGPVMLLAHSPEIFSTAVDKGIDLVLAGHTHGGQICLPGGVALYTNTSPNRRWPSGIFREGRTTMHVSRGVGTARFPIRLFCPPEIGVLRLVKR